MVYWGFDRRRLPPTGWIALPCLNLSKAPFRFPGSKKQIGRFWNERQIYEKSLAARAGAPAFVFYEGPPTANGLPHPGHCLTRAIKDLFPRYRTMRGYRCERKAGWDTHGLPVEVEVCKELGIHSKEEIEAYGVEPFIHKCLESVFRYTREWEQLTERLGFWIHLDEAYVTYPPELRRERLVGAEEPVRPRAALPGTQDRLVVGPGRHRASAAARSARAIARWPTRASMSGSRWSIRPASDWPTPTCWSGPPRRGRCRATSSRRSIRTWSTRS